MKTQKIQDEIYRLAVNIEEKDYLFEGIWPVPHGISINGYLIRSEKNIIIDLTQDIMDFPRMMTEQMGELSLGIEDIDIIILNHMEPDHAGWLREFCQKNDKGVIYCTKKAVPLLQAFAEVPAERAIAIDDGMVLSVGDYDLQFFETPNIHWPETMMTYEQKRGILFACDAFGSYGKVEDDAIFDDQLSSKKHAFLEQEALRYYANIVAAFSPFVLKGLTKLSALDLKIICPSHGIIWRENPSTIIDHYKRYAEYAKGPGEREVTLVWSSMYGNTKSILNLVLETLDKKQIPVHVFQVPGDEISDILASAWKSAGLIFGMPTYEYKVFPPMSQVISELMLKKVTNKKVFRYGSYGWIGGAQRDFEAKIEKSGWDLVNFYEWQGAPNEEEKAEMVKALEAYCDALIEFTEEK
ncbi:MAG: MBL fold metallo-hydrolase [Deltaproteobacteria bacterium]|nr:MAG: MBL fold metallo-hydrolase [Deltaproteobacteria bacterium]